MTGFVKYKIQSLKKFLNVQVWEALRYCRGKSTMCGCCWSRHGGPKASKMKKILLPGKTHVSRQIFIVIKTVLELFYDPTRNLWRNM